MYYTTAIMTTVAGGLYASIAIVVVGFKVTIDHSNTHVVKLCQLVKGKVHILASLQLLSI